MADRDGLMTGFCVYRLEELVRDGSSSQIGFKPPQTTEDQWEEELILNQHPEATSPPKRFLRRHLNGPLRLAERSSGCKRCFFPFFFNESLKEL